MSKILAVLLSVIAGHAFAQPVAQPKNQVMATPSGVNGFLAPRRMTAGDLPSVTPQYYGAACDGVTDDAIALTAWAAAITAGKTGYVSGTCLTSVALTFPAVNNLAIFGDGPGPSQLIYTGSSTTGDLFTFGGTGGGSVTGFSLKGIRFGTNTTMTSGVGVHLNYIGAAYLEDVTVDGQFGNGKFWNGLWVDRGGNDTIINLNARAQTDAVQLSGTGAVALADVYFHGGKIALSGVGIHIGGGVGGFNYATGDIIANGTGVIIDSALTSTRNFQIFFGQSFIDSSTVGPGIYLNDTLGVTFNSNLYLGNTWVASNQTHGVQIESGVAYTVMVDGGTINNNRGDGVRNSSTTDIAGIKNVYIANNGVSGTGYGLNNTVVNNNVNTFGVQYFNNTTGEVTGVTDTAVIETAGQMRTGNINIKKSSPALQWRNTGTAPADQNNWDMIVGSATGTMTGRACTDTFGACNTWLTITRAAAVPALATIVPNTAVTGTFAVTGTSSFTGALTPAGGIVGKTDASSATAGNLGEVIESSIASGSAVSLTSPNAANVTSVSLTAGDWNCEGNVNFYPAATTTQTRNRAWISLTTAAVPTLPNAGSYGELQTTIAANLAQSLTTGRFRVNVNATTTVFLSAAATFAVSTETAGGYIGCRRVR